MANRYWVGGSGNWNTASTTNWSATSGGTGGASLPTAADSVFFDQAGTYTVTCSNALNCLDITVSAGSVTFAAGTSPTLAIFGSMSLLAGTVWSAAIPSTFSATTTGKTVTTNGVTLSSVTFNGVGGGWALGSALNTNATLSTTLTNGSLALNGFDLSTGTFSSNNTNTRNITFGSNFINLITTNAGSTCISMANATGFTFTGTGGFKAQADITRTFVFGTVGGTVANAPNLTLTGSGTAVQTITTNSWFNKLDFGTTAFALTSVSVNVSSLILSSGGTFDALTPIFTTTQTWTPQFSKTLGGIGVNSVNGIATLTLGGAQLFSATSTILLINGTLDLGGYDITVQSISSNNTNTRSIVFGSNYITLTSGGTPISMTNASGFTASGTGGFKADASTTKTFTCGSTTAPIVAPNLFLTGTGTGALSFTASAQFGVLDFGTTASVVSGGVAVSGNLTLSASGTYTSLSVSIIGTSTVTANGKTILTFTVNCPAGTVTLNDSLQQSAANSTTLTAGTLNLNNNNLTTGIFSSSNTNTRAINFGTGFIYTTFTTAATTNVDITIGAGFSCSGTGGFKADASITRTFTVGTTSAPTVAPNLFLTGTGTSVQALTTGSIFGTLDFGTTAFSAGTRSLSVYSLVLGAGTYTGLTIAMVGTGIIYGNSKQISSLTINHTGTTSLTNPILVGATATTTLTSGTFDLNGIDFTTGVFSSTNTNTRAINFGSNFIFLATTSAAITNLSMATATSFTASGTGGFSTAMSVTRTFTVGTTGAPTVAPNLYLTSGASIPTFTTGSYFGSLNFTGSTCTPATTSLNLTGFVLGGGTYTNLTPTMVGSGTIDSAGKTIPSLTINHSGTTTLASSVTTTSVTLTQGTLNLSSSNISTNTFSSSGTAVRSITGDGGGATAIVVNGAGAAWTVTNGTNFTGSGYYIRMSSDSPKTFAGGGGAYGELRQYGVSTGVLTVTGSNSFTDIKATQVPATITFTAGTTQTVANFTLSGVSGFPVTINSTTAGSQYTLSKPSGTVSVDYLTIQDSNVTGGAYWGTTTSTFVSNNTGWNPPKSTGNFMAFF